MKVKIKDYAKGFCHMYIAMNIDLSEDEAKRNISHLDDLWEAFHLKDLSYKSVTECLEFMGQPVSIPRGFKGCEYPFDEYMRMVWKNNGITIHTLEGDHLAKEGDYIIKGVRGEFYPCKPDIFEQTYEIID